MILSSVSNVNIFELADSFGSFPVHWKKVKVKPLKIFNIQICKIYW